MSDKFKKPPPTLPLLRAHMQTVFNAQQYSDTVMAKDSKAYRAIREAADLIRQRAIVAALQADTTLSERGRSARLARHEAELVRMVKNRMESK